MSKENDIFEQNLAEEISKIEITTKKKKEDVVEKKEPEVIEQLTWVEVQAKFKGELTSRFIHELSKLKGHQFTSKYLQFAEFIMPKQQRVEGVVEGEDTEINVNITKTIDNRTIIVNDILSQHGIDVPDLPDKEIKEIKEYTRNNDDNNQNKE